MGLVHCKSCESVEGHHRLITKEELKEAYSEAVASDEDVKDCPENWRCLECGTVGEIQLIPEHDDFIFER